MPTGTSKRVVKVTISAPVVSFRYPHFLIARQPTFDMPPPSTIFGHVASALGVWPTSPVEFAYSFDWRSKTSDLEHQHVASVSHGKLPVEIQDPLWRPRELPQGKKLTKKQQEAYTKPLLLERTTEAVVQPHEREFLFDIRLELYLDPPELAEAFRMPVFPVVLGRSQDLACIEKVEVVELQSAQGGYLENTIVPGDLRRQLPWGVTVLMPRYIGPAPERKPVFAPYIALRDRVYVGADENVRTRRLLSIEGEAQQWWSDPATAEEAEGNRLLWFHRIDPAEFAS